MEQASADAIKLNIYAIATDPAFVKRAVRIPLAVKLSPFFSAPANMGLRFDEARADGIVLFNRFYQPDFDIEHLEVSPSLMLSRPEELLMRLHWTATLCGHVRADLGITGGVYSSRDLVKCILAGAKVAFMTSALLRNGVQHAAYVLTELDRWLEEHEYRSVQQMRGSMSQGAVPDPSAFERRNYITTNQIAADSGERELYRLPHRSRCSIHEFVCSPAGFRNSLRGCGSRLGLAFISPAPRKLLPQYGTLHSLRERRSKLPIAAALLEFLCGSLHCSTLRAGAAAVLRCDSALPSSRA
jgi:hypothetical protein